jgi:hypothetical protein
MDIVSPTIKCPECGTEIPLTETIAAPLIERARVESEAKLRDALDAKQAAEQKLLSERQQIEVARAGIEAEVAKQLSTKLTEGEKVQRERIRTEMEAELEGSKAREVETMALLKTTQQEVLEAMKAQQKAEIAAQSAEIEAQKKVQAEVAQLKEDAQREAQEAERLRVAEKDKQIDKLLQQLDEAKRQAQQGSQQMQGEILELDLETTLRATFPWDEIEPVKAGQRGGDLVHRVMTGPGQLAGTIMWEIKRTQNWGGDWPAKAKQDAATVKAEIVIIVSEVCPKGIECFGLVEGVWAVKPSYAVAVTHALRQQMDQVAAARRLSVGKQGKAELLYDYLTGPEFRARLEGIVEPFVQMQADLDSEKRSTMSRWKRTEKRIERVLISASSLSGDLQGIGGREMPELPAFVERCSEIISEEAALEN